MTTITHSPAKATFSPRSFVGVLVVFVIISFGIVWAFTSPAAPKPIGPQAAAVPTPPSAVAAPAQPAVFNPQPAPVPVPTPPVPASSAEPHTTATVATPMAPTGLWVLPLALLIGVALGLKLRRTASFQPRAFAR